MTDLPIRQRQVLAAYEQAVAAGEPCGAVSLAHRLGISPGGTGSALRQLRTKGLIPERPPGSTLMPDEAPERPGIVDPPAPPPEVQPAAPSLSERLLEALQRRKDQVLAVDDLADRYDVSPRRVREALDELTGQGYNIYQDQGHVSLTREDEPSERITQPVQGNGRIRFGAISDTHLCHKKERLDVLTKLYDLFAAEGIDTVYHAGNIVEGESRFNVRERKVHGLDAQVDYLLEHYPQRRGVRTRFIAGDDHEGWWQQREGISIGRHIQRKSQEVGRTDLEYLGYIEADVEFRNEVGSFMMRIMHPGGGKTYAKSYKPQKIVESFQGGEKPAVLLLGHYHTMEYLPAIRNVRVFQLGCTVEQGPWARKQTLDYELGGWIIELVQCPKSGACIGCAATDRTFFDKGFYQKFED